MVYRGKPSRSCRDCRKRDIKCDKRADGCSQCSRAGIPCSGYPNTTDLIIYDETRSTISKRQRSELSRSRPPSVPDLLSSILLPTFEVRAKHLFVSQYVLDSDQTNLFAYMRVFYPPESVKFPLLATVVRAVWLAFFSFSHQSSMALHKARVNYGSALTLAATAIQSPSEVKENTTLGSLLLMSVYERLVYWGGNIAPSNAHLRGALGLVLCGGSSQFDDPIRMDMLLGLCELVIFDCLAHETDIPPDLLTLSSKVAVHASVTPKWEFLRVLLEYAQLREMLRYEITPERAIAVAERLSCKLVDIPTHLPQFIYREQTRQHLQTTKAETIGYPNHNTRRSWNNIRIIRILLADIIREQCNILLGTPGVMENTLLIEKLHESICTLISLCSEICSSASDSGLLGCAADNVSGVQISTLFFHLYTTNTIKVIPNQLKQLLHHRLQALSNGQFPGIKRLMDHLLRDTDGYRENIWKVWLRLGKESFSI